MKIMGFSINFRLSNLYRIFMQKRIEENSAHSSRSMPKRQKSQIPQQMSNPTSNSIYVGQNSDQRILHQVNFQFDTLDNRNPKSEARKIHSKQGTKRIGGKVVMPEKRQRRERKENISQKKRQQLEIKDFRNESFISKDSTQVVLLQIKSCKIEKQSPPQNSNRLRKHTRHSSNIDSSKNTNEQQDSPYQNPTNPQPTITDQLFNAINRKMMQEQELKKVQRTSKNCFFLNLKKKLQKEINRIDKQSQRTEAKFLIKGCQIEKHRRNVSTKCSLTERTRPRTAISSAKTELSSRNTLNDRSRPMSCRARSSIQSNPLKMIKEQSLKILSKPQPKRQRNTVKEKECENKYIMNNLASFHDSSTLKLYKSQNKESTVASKASLNCQQQNDKLNKILIECQALETNTTSLTSKMKTFEYYCKKIDIGMQKAGHRLSDLNYAIQNDDD